MSPSVWLQPRAAPAAVSTAISAAGTAAPAAARAATPPLAPPTPGRRFAYVTLLTKDAYLPGVQALARSLVAVGARYPLIVMYTRTCSQGALEALRREGLHLRFAEQFQAEGVDHSEYKRALYLECWNKLRMWEMTEWDRLIYLDADMALVRSIDHLFSLPPGFWAVGDCYGGRETEEERTSCCHFTPDATPPYFNAGFYVMAPSLAELGEMKAALAAGTVPVRFFAEQDFLNGFFKGRWKHLPYGYNAQKRIKQHHPDLWDWATLYNIHYVDEKPWSHRYSEENLQYKEEVEYWWAVFEGRLAPQALPAARQLSAGLDDLLGLRPSSALGAAEEAAAALASRAGTPTPFGPGGALERAGSLLS